MLSTAVTQEQAQRDQEEMVLLTAPGMQPCPSPDTWVLLCHIYRSLARPWVAFDDFVSDAEPF